MATRIRDFFHYLSPHPDDRIWGVEPLAGGRTIIGKNQQYPPPGHPGGHAFSWSNGRTLSEFQIIYIASGSGTFRSHRLGERAVSAGDVLLLFPGEWHSYKPDLVRGWDERWLAFTGHVPLRLLAAQIIHPSRALIATRNDTEVVEALDRALDRLRREPPGFRAELATSILAILARVTALETASHELSSYGVRMRAVARRIQEECPAHLDVAGLAEDVGMSVAHFRRLFTQELGVSPKKYHQHIRLLRARHMLADHRSRIKDVAEALGFSSEFYFSRLFRRHVGQSPHQWRSGAV